MAKYSLGELDALSKKAARGAGYSWGIAEEVGKSIRWLSAYGFQGVEALSEHLLMVSDAKLALLPALKEDSADEKSFENNKGNLCALSCNAFINDLGHHVNANTILSFSDLFFPVLALPAAGRIAETYKISVFFEYADTIIVCKPNGIAIKDTPPLFGTFTLINQANVVCKRVPKDSSDTHLPSSESRAISTEAIEVLEKYAHLTYAPDTEESRLRGAGEG